ncbi:putative disease resistance RPP13-like protein 1 isoform X2 [Trifolium pratense]|uniref:putative disease resistance RPP13-like protein 1 isoform X2 n=1 Tax=Trifolium pratense TaxID=57577 RepID=UPI001E692EEA|nr:putative disease resistance RPP13-like protein 1 isoform X2 [Trifolium pratense]XP_045819826.1 putative disease resistance RPP13-like protein 1 isoform X2 [Trifolium pratense]XP_045819827.1 putative disease resistance RPP13-like protein 1 isoform X2 [Trifolium pratense]
MAFLSSVNTLIGSSIDESSFDESSIDESLDGKSKTLDKLKKELDIKLNSVNLVLEEAEIKQYQNKHVKTWHDELKHAVYEAEQILDEIDTDAMLNKMKAESEPVTNFISGITRINEVLKYLQLLTDQKKDLGLEDGPCASKEGLVSWKPATRSSTTALVDESTIYGRGVQKEQLIKLLLEGNDSGNQVPPIISIFGLGGMGKTTLAKLVYNDKKIKEHFDLKAWVYVSESFNDVGLTKAILRSFDFSEDGKDLNVLQHQLQHKLTGKKYLLVLDDIWNGNAECWEQLLLPFNQGTSGSKIIVTTRQKEVVDVLNSTLFDLEQLDKSDCWSLFVSHAFHGKDVREYPNLEYISKKIVDKCGGLPLTIKTLGQLLRRKFSEHEWRKILETNMWRLSDANNNINPVLRLSYHNLPSNRKRCFAYCSLFPKGYGFGKGELIKFWMADGLLKCSGADKSEEELGNEIFTDLESISFFQKSLYGVAFVMHDLVNDLAKSVSGEFCMEIVGSRVEGIPERTRPIQLSLRYLNCGNKLLEPIFECKGLRSLILQDCKATLLSNNVQRDLFSRLTWLRMLSFRYCGLSELVDEIGNLKLLRYLDLSHTQIKSLPDTICMLYNLQTLLLRGCKLTELPSNFAKLINLRHLELPSDRMDFPVLKKMPKNIGMLNKLQYLPYFIVEEQHGSNIKELEKLNHLHGTIKITGLGVIDHVDVAKANLKDKKYLEELYMDFYKNGKEEMNEWIVERNVSVLEALHPNSNLKRLTIVNYSGNSFPNWLRGSDLPNLVSLKLKNCPKLEECLCLEGSPLLKELYISKCSKLKRVPLPQHLPSLQKLYICDCEMLEASILKGDSMIELVLERCYWILVNELPTSLKKFVLLGNRYVEFSDEQNLVNCTILDELEFDFRGSVVKRPSLDLRCYNSLCYLTIKGWDSSSSLPLSLHLFTNLEHLCLYDCPQLESFSRGGLPSNLSSLEISNCPKLIGSREEWGLFQLNSLINFTVRNHEFENVESFPEENLLPPTLVSLWLTNCSKLRIMNNKGFLHLNSLTYLRIYKCPSLESLPEEGLQQLSSLSMLWIKKCPLIREKYKKEGGERWHSISHIPEVKIDYIEQHK